MTALTPPQAYRKEIDGLRAFAVLSVVIYHAFPGLIPGGFVGVDVFFVISGFLISTHIYQSLDTGSFSFSDFFGRRIRRIFPALALVMLTSLCMGTAILLNDELVLLGKHVAAGAAFVSNLVLVSEAGYFDQASETKPLLHLWSLAVEEQFYIIWPLVLWSAWRFGLNVLKITIGVAVLSFVLSASFVHSHPTETFFWPIGRFWELLSGSLLAWVTHYKRPRIAEITNTFDTRMHSLGARRFGITAANVMAVCGACGLAIGVIWITSATAFPGPSALFPVLGAVLIIAAGPTAWINRVIFMNPLAVWVGLISYPLYLWHWPLLSFLHIWHGDVAPIEERGIALALSVGLAWVTFQFIEKPIRKRGHWPAKTAMATAAVVSLFLAGMAIFATKAQLLPQTAKRSVAASAVSSPLRDACHFPRNRSYRNRRPCQYFQEPASVAILGNSHSVELAHALAQSLAPEGAGLEHHTMSGCTHNYGLDEQPEGQKVCVEWHDRAVKAINANKEIKTVVVHYRTRLQDTALRSALIDMLTDLAESKDKVIFVFQTPMPKEHINSSIRASVTQKDSDVVGRTRAQWETRSKDRDAFLGQLPSNVIVFDPIDLFCSQTDCFVIKSGKALFFDHHHMSLHGAQLLVPDLMRLIGQDK